MQALAYQRCYNHAEREAVARCPQCTQFFCRECITEHDDRVICAACLKKLARTPLFQRKWWGRLVQAGQVFMGVIAAWFFFYFIGELLVKLPDEFHEGQLWHGRWLDKE